MDSHEAIPSEHSEPDSADQAFLGLDPVLEEALIDASVLEALGFAFGVDSEAYIWAKQRLEYLRGISTNPGYMSQ